MGRQIERQEDDTLANEASKATAVRSSLVQSTDHSVLFCQQSEDRLCYPNLENRSTKCQNHRNAFQEIAIWPAQTIPKALLPAARSKDTLLLFLLLWLLLRCSSQYGIKSDARIVLRCRSWCLLWRSDLLQIDLQVCVAR